MHLLLPILGLILCIALYITNLGDTLLFFQDDEWLYIKIASEMFDRGEIWTPYWLGEKAYYKPPLTYWLMMALFPFGEDRFYLARLSVSLTSLASIAAIWFFGRSLYGRAEAGLAAILAATTFGFLAFGRVGVMDMLLAFTMTLPLLLFWLAWRKKSGALAALCYITMGVSTLVKGPVAPLTLAVAEFSFLILFGGWRTFFSRTAWAGAFTGLLILFSWPIGIYCKGEWSEWYQFFIIQENLGKFGDPTDYPALPFVAHLLRWLAPWSILFLCSLLAFVQRSLWRKPEFIFPLLWIGAIIGVHLIPEVRLPWYMFLAVPPAILFCAAILLQPGRNALLGISHWLTALILLLPTAASLVLLRFFPFFSRPFILLFLSACAWTGAVYNLTKKQTAVAAACFALGLLFMIPSLSGIIDDRFPLEARTILANSDQPVAIARLKTGRLSQEHAMFSYYTNRRIQEYRSTKDLTAFINNSGALIISDTDYRELLQERSGVTPQIQIVFSWRQWKDSISQEQLLSIWQQADLTELQEPYHIIRIKK